MILTIDTSNFSEADARAVVLMTTAYQPDVLPAYLSDVVKGLAAVSGAANEPEDEEPEGPTESAEAAFDNGYGPTDVIRSAEEAFGDRPQPDAVAAATGSSQHQPAPAGQPAPTSASLADVVVYAAGVPWDERIHSSGRATVKDGTWKKKKNVDPAEVTRVTAELKAAMGRPTPAPEPTAGPPSAEPVPLPPAAIEHAQAAVLAEFDQPSPAAVFTGIMQLITGAQNANKITPEQVATVREAVGLASLTDLLRPPGSAKAAEFRQAIEAMIG